MTDKEIVERAKEAEKSTGFGELVHSHISKGVNSAFGIGFVEGMVEYRKSLQEEPVSEDFEQELYKAFGQVKDFTLGMQIAKRFYDMGRNSKEPVSEDLEKAAKKEAEIVNALGGEFPPNPLDMELIKTIFIHGAKWQKEQEYTCYEEAFEDGASWKKEEMMKDAVDAKCGRILREDGDELQYIVNYPRSKRPFEKGDKVKVIIIKENKDE